MDDEDYTQSSKDYALSEEWRNILILLVCFFATAIIGVIGHYGGILAYGAYQTVKTADAKLAEAQAKLDEAAIFYEQARTVETDAKIFHDIDNLEGNFIRWECEDGTSLLFYCREMRIGSPCRPWYTHYWTVYGENYPNDGESTEIPPYEDVGDKMFYNFYHDVDYRGTSAYLRTFQWQEYGSYAYPITRQYSVIPEATVEEGLLSILRFVDFRSEGHMEVSISEIQYPIARYNPDDVVDIAYDDDGIMVHGPKKCDRCGCADCCCEDCQCPPKS